MTPSSAQRKTCPEPLEPSVDDALMDAFRSGDAAAIAHVYRTHFDAVARLVQRLLGSHHDHDDIVQITFLKAIRSAETFRGGSHNLRAWLRQIATMEVRMWLRKQRTKHWLSFRDPATLPQVATRHGSPEGRLAVQRVYGLLARMKPDERLYFALRYIDERKVDEIAATFDVSRSTAKRRLIKARRHFEKLARADMILCDWLSSLDEEGST